MLPLLTYLHLMNNYCSGMKTPKNESIEQINKYSKFTSFCTSNEFTVFIEYIK